MDKMDYSKNCAPFSIYPFDIKTITDIMLGQLMICCLFNYSEVLRIVQKSGWDVVDSIVFRSEEEIKLLNKNEIKDIPFMKIKKGTLSINVPPSLIARLKYELLAPSTIIEEFEETYKREPQTEFNYSLVNYIDDQRIWD